MFQCQIPQAPTSPSKRSEELKPSFHQFQVVVNEPDPPLEGDLDDLFEESQDKRNGEEEWLPDLLPIPESDISSDESTDHADSEEEYNAGGTGNQEGQNQGARDKDTDRVPHASCPGKEREAPTLERAREALDDLCKLLRPPRKTGRGYINPKLNPFVHSRMEGMKTMLNNYIQPLSRTHGAWVASSLQTAVLDGHGCYCARRLRILCRQFIQDRTFLPVNPYGNWNESLLVDEDLTNDLSLYLMEIGKEISAKKLMNYLNSDPVRSKHGIEKPISERTARRYLNMLGYRWSTPKKGQYANGHEREDVVYYREQVFLPQWRRIEQRMANWIQNDVMKDGPRIPGLETEVIVCRVRHG